MGKREPVLWVARDRDGEVWMYFGSRPIWDEDRGVWHSARDEDDFEPLPKAFLPTLAPGRVMRVSLVPDEEGVAE